MTTKAHDVSWDALANLRVRVEGSKKTADEYDHLSPEESKRRLRILAAKMDRNKDGFVSKEELAEWIAQSLRNLDEEEVDERIDEMDDDKDGKVTWDEYRKDAFGDDDGEQANDPDDIVS